MGEVRGGEAFDLLQALNTGHAGTLSTIHANGAEQALSRFTSCVLQGGVELPYQAIRHQIADAIDLVLQLDRRDGHRMATELLRVTRFDAPSDRYEGALIARTGEGRRGRAARVVRAPGGPRVREQGHTTMAAMPSSDPGEKEGER